MIGFLGFLGSMARTEWYLPAAAAGVLAGGTVYGPAGPALRKLGRRARRRIGGRS